MLGRSSSTRVAIAGLIGSMASVGASVGRSLRDAGAQAIEIVNPNKDRDGMPIKTRTPGTSKRSVSVAEGKRNALKVRNRRRNRRAHK
jgi:hypothetical protein